MTENKNAKTPADDGQPVAWRSTSPDGKLSNEFVGTSKEVNWTPIYTAPPKQWVGLGEDEIFSILENLQTIYNRPPTEDSRIIFARAIEAKLKEKNT